MDAPLRVLVLGAAGFIGGRVARALAAEPMLGRQRVGELVLCDRRPALVPAQAACKVGAVAGELGHPALLDRLFDGGRFDVVFHLAAALTLEAEADAAHGLQVNVLALIDLLARCRGPSSAPATRLLFASSISTYGGALPAVVDETVFQSPRTSYGAHKVIAEQLLADASRRGDLDARVLRLPIVLTHPGPASGSVSDQVAALIREPLAGGRAVCRFAPQQSLAVVSVDTVVAAFLRLAALPAADVEGARLMNLPALTVTPARIVDAAARRLGAAPENVVDWQADAPVQAIVDSWPGAFVSRLGAARGIHGDTSIEAIIDAHAREHGRTA